MEQVFFFIRVHQDKTETHFNTPPEGIKTLRAWRDGSWMYTRTRNQKSFSRPKGVWPHRPPGKLWELHRELDDENSEWRRPADCDGK